MFRRLRLLVLALCALHFSACATPPTRRTDLRPPADVAEGLKRYHEERLYPSTEGGYRQRQQHYDGSQLPAFYDAQGATLSAAWARKANSFRRTGLLSGLAILGVGIGLSANAPSGDVAKNAWWASLLPAVALGYTFEWIGDGWFRKPSVALYNKRLAEKMGMQVAPFYEDEY